MDDFLRELQAAVEKEERESIGLQDMTGDAEQDRRLIDCDSKADYFIKLVKKSQEEIDKINDYVDQEIEKARIIYDNYRNEEVAKRQKQIDYFKFMLETYTIDSLEGKKARSIKLPHGVLQIRKQQPTITVSDETLEWLINKKPELVKTETKVKTSVDKNKLKKDGFINDSNVMFVEVDNVEVEVPGVTVTQNPDKFEIK